MAHNINDIIEFEHSVIGITKCDYISGNTVYISKGELAKIVKMNITKEEAIEYNNLYLDSMFKFSHSDVHFFTRESDGLLFYTTSHFIIKPKYIQRDERIDALLN